MARFKVKAVDTYRQPASWTPTPNELGSSAK